MEKLSDQASRPHDELKNILRDDLEEVSNLIKLRMKSEHAPLIEEIADHLLKAGGKRLRPLLTLASAKICGYQGYSHIQLAAAVEFIHTATLLHDDVVDESDRRRGKSSVNILWDNASSVLVGDYLFARSFQLMTNAGRLDILEILSAASAKIAEGEVLQLSSTGDLKTKEETYYKIIRGKTAALFSASMEVGALIADADKEVVESLYRYGDALGVSFQITDDLLDFDGGSSSLGKNTGDDFKEQKLTLPIIHALSNATEAEFQFWQRTIERGEQIDGDFKKAVNILERHSSIEFTKMKAIEWCTIAKKSLADLPDQALKTILLDLADYVVSRAT
ncbi:MAG: polyprenyl synthetase family protein [Proteobacteria bacterium]|nr:polyprenyl synthetase family protein [Pseudomonadota bacterium]